MSTLFTLASMDTLRAALGAIAFVGALVAPPWVTILALVFLCLRFRAIEAIAIGAFADMLWLPETLSLPLVTLAAVILVWGLEPLRLEFLR